MKGLPAVFAAKMLDVWVVVVVMTTGEYLVVGNADVGLVQDDIEQCVVWRSWKDCSETLEMHHCVAAACLELS